MNKHTCLLCPALISELFDVCSECSKKRSAEGSAPDAVSVHRTAVSISDVHTTAHAPITIAGAKAAHQCTFVDIRNGFRICACGSYEPFSPATSRATAEAAEREAHPLMTVVVPKASHQCDFTFDPKRGARGVFACSCGAAMPYEVLDRLHVQHVLDPYKKGPLADRCGVLHRERDDALKRVGELEMQNAKLRRKR